MTKYNTNMASEFYVLSMLHRLEVDAALTLGNKKAVDIIVANENGETITIDVKGLAGRYDDWYADNIRSTLGRQHFYVLVSFNGKKTDPDTPPKAWIIPANEVDQFIKKYRNQQIIPRKLLNTEGERFLHAWGLITKQTSK